MKDECITNGGILSMTSVSRSIEKEHYEGRVHKRVLRGSPLKDECISTKGGVLRRTSV